jgi:hypothetical protein
MDGPVVTAAREALERHDVRLILPYVKASGEAEVREAFERVLGARDGNPVANELADRYFFETVVRVHRAGEGAPYTGLKPAGLPVGPVIPVAERAIESGDPSELIGLLTEKAHSEIERRFHQAMERKSHASESVKAGREYVESVLGLQVWAHKVYGCLSGGAHDEEAGGVHAHG